MTDPKDLDDLRRAAREEAALTAKTLRDTQEKIAADLKERQAEAAKIMLRDQETILSGTLSSESDIKLALQKAQLEAETTLLLAQKNAAESLAKAQEAASRAAESFRQALAVIDRLQAKLDKEM